MRSTGLACAVAVLLILGVVDTSLTLTGSFTLRSKISEKEVLAAQEAWGEALVSISLTYEEHGWDAAKDLAEKVIDEAYGYNYGPVLFKPTLTTGTQVFRPTKEGALAYFVGGDKNFPNDKGFALKGWRKVEIKNAAIYREGNVALTVGNVLITDKSGGVTTVDKTWTFYKGKDRKLRIVSHHSSLPFTG
eukprot:CAMPEP_0113827540 /NCGR_PEP_ID=MMETSP0328-20130328/4817_1 /TAXON_ID=39455 /ORGANISM="Alexandrium minutum" /LENGTH=189 /DNA_ID=CAMNT_0000795527 /DNA_START=11 /DNA_END=580 /DNA_ORIENTATION=- /assembly_acc=CAM_ASM_000350